ncbi:hypothetical protein CPC735_066290 [Coccidioides posadasii C735 delta SOWgp]|uniref:Uncharacterized protein n=1 Tax=Coccidioides posadasii (strain C735) TaxID=222929 RepID=C5PC52_COCP7|nr:hypothetical protein CPC735_066290 [Coccidioides posadasii C735 delta SOWgp]EER25529.1 hypothetical protein CPC735_066290 [Coccidioides posadasii C735 delta SOWgp]|eukprot:XP_003067674.1 hypothetical protein CPC735_066290 [Coccidioides posadasii C735 delta SOWgp]
MDHINTRNNSLPMEAAQPRPAMVDDMIHWLWYDGFYRGVVGWVNYWPIDELFNNPQPAPGLPGFDYEDGSDQFDMRDFDFNAALGEVAKETAFREYVKRMIRRHRQLLPAAIDEIDRRLLREGVSQQEVNELTTGAASDAYGKLARLEEARRPFPMPERVQFRVISDLPGREWLPSDLYLEHACGLTDLVDAIQRHRLIRYYPARQIGWTTDENRGVNNYSSLSDDTNDGTRRKMLAYKLIPKDNESTWVAQNTDGWDTISDDSVFVKMMGELQQDETKIAAICHESTLENIRQKQEQSLAIFPEDFRLLKPKDMDLDLAATFEFATEAWEEVEGCTPFPPDFDWSRLENGRIKNPDGTLPSRDDEL